MHVHAYFSYGIVYQVQLLFVHFVGASFIYALLDLVFWNLIYRVGFDPSCSYECLKILFLYVRSVWGPNYFLS